MTELSKTALVSTETGKGKEVEFIVHKNATCCSYCYQWPIIGQIYVSDSNQIGCARCVEKTSGKAPNLHMKLASASADEKKISRQVMVKLKIDNGGIVEFLLDTHHPLSIVENRRISVEGLWDKSTCQFSFVKLLTFAAGCIFPSIKASFEPELGSFVSEVKAVNKEDTTSKAMSNDGNMTVHSDYVWEKDGDYSELGEDVANNVKTINKHESTKVLHVEMDKLTMTSDDDWEPKKNNRFTAVESLLTKAKFTYIDEDGEVTTISSNEELEDAFRQFFKKFHENETATAIKKYSEKLFRFRISMTIPPK